MNKRAGNKNGKYPTYANIEIKMTREEFETWVNEFESQWNQIKESGDVPTIDRIDPEGHYEISNIRVLGRRENSRQNAPSKRRPQTLEQLGTYIVRCAKRLNIPLDSVVELIIKEQVDCSTK